MKTFIPRGKIFGPIIPEFLFSTGLSFEAIIMYSILCNFAGNKDHCWPSYETLYKKLGQKRSIRSIKSYIAELEEKHFIEVVRGKYKSNIYYLIHQNCEPSIVLVKDEIDFVQNEFHSNSCNNNDDTCYKNSNMSNSEKYSRQSAEFAHHCENFAPYRENHSPKLNSRVNKNTITPPLPPSAENLQVKSVADIESQPAAGSVCASVMDFGKVWEVYPKKESKQSALKQWRRLAKSHALPPLSQILSVIAFRSTTCAWRKEHGRYVPRLAKWLSDRRWEDEFTGDEKLAFDQWIAEQERARAYALQAKKRQEQQQQEREDEQEEFTTLAAKFSSYPVSQETFAFWKMLRARGDAPSPNDVPPDNSQDMLAFMKLFQRQKLKTRLRESKGVFATRFLKIIEQKEREEALHTDKEEKL